MISGPREVLISMTPSFIREMVSRLMRFAVSGKSGQWRLITSLTRSSSSRETHSGAPGAVSYTHLGDGHRRRACAADDHADGVLALADDLQRVGQARQGDDRGAVLIVMEDRDIALFLQLALDFEAAGRGDVLQVHAAEAAGDEVDGIDDLVHIVGLDAEREGVHIAEGLEQHALAFHDGHARLGADVTQTQHLSLIHI